MSPDLAWFVGLTSSLSALTHLLNSGDNEPPENLILVLPQVVGVVLGQEPGCTVF